MPETRTFVEREGLRLAVREWPGPADHDGPPVLLLHGLSSSSHIWNLAASLLARRRRVVAYDQRGHGESGKPRSGYGFDELAADAGAVIRELRIRRPLVVGHSWGATVALEVAVRKERPVGGAVLLDGGFISMSDRMDWPTARELLRPPQIDGMPVAEFLETWERETGLRVTPEIERLCLSIVRVGQDGAIRRRLSVANHMKILRAMWEHDVVRSLRSVRVPTLVLATRRRGAGGDEARFIEAKREAARAARAIGDPVRFEWIEGIHDVPLERPEAVARRILRFPGRMAP